MGSWGQYLTGMHDNLRRYLAPLIVCKYLRVSGLCQDGIMICAVIHARVLGGPKIASTKVLVLHDLRGLVLFLREFIP